MKKLFSKKMIPVLLTLIMIFALTACAANGNGGDAPADPPAVVDTDTDDGNDVEEPADDVEEPVVEEDPADEVAIDEGGDEALPTGGFVQGVTDTTIYIGNSVAVSGALAPVGVPFKAGMDAYILMVNEGGGIGGRQIVYVHQDDGFDPAQGLAILDGLINDDQVFAIVGHFGTPVIGATFQEIIDTRIPTVYFSAGTGLVYNENATDGDGRNTFPVQPVFPMEGRVFAAWAAGTFGAERIGVIFTNDDAGTDLLAGIEQEAATIGGLEVISEQVAPGQDDVTAAVASILAADVDIIVIAAIQGTFPNIARGLAAQGNTLPALTSYVNVDATMVALVADEVGTQFDIFGSAWVDMTTDALALYAEWVAQVSDEDFTANAFGIAGWVAMSFFVEGLNRVGYDELTWESFIEAMESAPVANPFGSAVDFSNGSRVGTQDLSLWRMDADDAAGWVQYLPFMSMSEILGN